MYATVELEMKYKWPPGFQERLPYTHRLLEWRSPAGSIYDAWAHAARTTEVVQVRRLMTRNPGFQDYDLAAFMRAASFRVLLENGCTPDLIVDASIGMHLTNSGVVHRGMWYGREMIVLSRVCHCDHPNHSASWVIPQDSWQHHWTKTLLFTAISGLRRWASQDQVTLQAFAALESYV